MLRMCILLVLSAYLYQNEQSKNVNYSSKLSLIWTLDWLDGQTRNPSHRRLGASQGRSVRVRKISPPLGFEPRTAQPIASR